MRVSNRKDSSAACVYYCRVSVFCHSDLLPDNLRGERLLQQATFIDLKVRNNTGAPIQRQRSPLNVGIIDS